MGEGEATLSTRADAPRPAEGSRPPTMREVAALAGVGIKTVSRVVNGEPGVSVEKHARVRSAIERLDYQRDLNASMLRRTGRRTATIGLVLEDVGNPFSSALSRTIEDEARARGVLVFTGSCDEDPAREREIVATLRERRVDGILLVPVGKADHSYLRAERESGTPIVFLDRPARFLDADAVLADNHQGARMAVQHLAARGHRRIAFLGDDGAIHTAMEREAGFRAERDAQGLDDDAALVRQGLRGVGMAEAVAGELLAMAEPPTAIFAAQNLLTIGAIRALRARALDRSVALVGFDDFDLADLLDPPVTVVAQDAAVIGRLAAERLFARIGGEDGPFRRQVVPVALIPRGSGEIAPPAGSR